MKQLVAVLLVLILIHAGKVFGFQALIEWVKYDSSEGHYSVLLPTQPKLSTQEAATTSGERFPQYLASASEANAVFLIGYYEHVSGATFSFDKARDEMVQAVKGTLVSEGPISLGGIVGRELKVFLAGTDGTEYLLWARFYDLDKRVYSLQFITAKSSDDNASKARAAKFFDSFKVIKTP